MSHPSRASVRVQRVSPSTESCALLVERYHSRA
ncbi:hypothetical protein [Erythrobacter sp.]